MVNNPSITREMLRSIVIDQREQFASIDRGIERSILATVGNIVSSPQITIISGLRRVGKSTLLSQIASKYLGNKYYYISFEDERLARFSVDDFEKLYKIFLEEYGEYTYFLIDEIQNVPEWERFVRRMHDRQYRFVITGSNASLLSRELGTRLTGRYIKIELYPFSFVEYLQYHNVKLGKTSRALALINRHCKQYLTTGGIPDSIKYPELKIHQTLYNDVIYRDIVARYNLENTSPIKELGSYILGNIANQISFNKLKELLKLGSVTTVKKYIDYFAESWLFFIVNKYAYSIKEQSIAAKKIYCIDNGFTTKLGFSFSPNDGRLLENAVYLEQKRRNLECYYYRTQSGKEVDFFVPKTKTLTQVAYDIDDPITMKRECEALIEASKELSSNEAVKCVIVTMDKYIKTDDAFQNIKIISIADYLLSFNFSKILE